jgi:hypothetical protein
MALNRSKECIIYSTLGTEYGSISTASTKYTKEIKVDVDLARLCR